MKNRNDKFDFPEIRNGFDFAELDDLQLTPVQEDEPEVPKCGTFVQIACCLPSDLKL